MQPISPTVLSIVTDVQGAPDHLRMMLNTFIAEFMASTTGGTIATLATDHSIVRLDDGQVLVTLIVTGTFEPHHAEAHQDAVQPSQN